jgi:Fe-S cluster assembly scaffold protein SufB
MEDKKTYTLARDVHRTITIDAPGVYEIQLTGEGAQATISGIFAAAGKEQKNITVIINHQAAHTRSNTVLKGVVRDHAQVSFTGRIIVAEHCPDTNAFLTERILLLSDTAKAEAVPELEILTDDVKCSHAASISHIPEAQLFYLKSRGIAHSEAEALIVQGFLEAAE